MYTKGMIEAEYQRDLVKAEEVYQSLREKAERDKKKRLIELYEKEREDFKYEQQFFYQG